MDLIKSKSSLAQLESTHEQTIKQQEEQKLITDLELQRLKEVAE